MKKTFIVNGEEKTISELARMSGLNRQTIWNRVYKLNQPIEKAINNNYRPKSNSRLYNIWRSMKSRCYNKNDPLYNNYGARGITLSDEWKNSFQQFWYDMKDTYGENLYLNRININGNYTKENCMWATTIQYYINKTLIINGEEKNILDWMEITGLKQNTILGRIRRKSKCNLLDSPLNKPIIINVDGEDFTLRQLSEKYNINKRTLYSRIHQLNWTIEKALGLTK